MQLHDTEAYESQIEMHNSTSNTDISLERKLKKPYNPAREHGLLDQKRTENAPVNRSGLIMSIMSKTENMCHIYQLKNVMCNNSVPIIVILLYTCKTS